MPATRCSPELTQEIVRLISVGGVSFRAALARCGVAKSTGHGWLSRGEGRDPDLSATKTYRDFAKAIRAAEEDAKISSLTRIRMAGAGRQRGKTTVTTTEQYAYVRDQRTGTITEQLTGKRVVTVEETPAADWRADAWYLEHCAPDEFSGRQSIDISGEVTQAIVMVPEESEDSDEWGKDVARAHERAAQAETEEENAE